MLIPPLKSRDERYTVMWLSWWKTNNGGLLKCAWGTMDLRDVTVLSSLSIGSPTLASTAVKPSVGVCSTSTGDSSLLTGTFVPTNNNETTTEHVWVSACVFIGCGISMPWTYVAFIFSSVETSPPGFLLVVAVLEVSQGCFLGKKRMVRVPFARWGPRCLCNIWFHKSTRFFFHNRALKTVVFGVIKNLIVARVGLLWSLTAAWYVCNVGWVSAVLPVPGVPYMPEVGYSFKTVLVHNLLLCGFVLLF